METRAEVGAASAFFLTVVPGSMAVTLEHVKNALLSGAGAQFGLSLEWTEKAVAAIDALEIERDRLQADNARLVAAVRAATAIREESDRGCTTDSARWWTKGWNGCRVAFNVALSPVSDLVKEAKP